MLLLIFPCFASENEQGTPIGNLGQPYLVNHQVCVDGLLHTFTVFKDDTLHQFIFELELENTTDDAIVLNYGTGENFDFSVHQSGKLIWRAHHEWFFVQNQTLIKLEAGGTEEFSFVWDGLTNDWSDLSCFFSPGQVEKLNFWLEHKLLPMPVTYGESPFPEQTPTPLDQMPATWSVVQVDDPLPADHWSHDSLKMLKDHGMSFDGLDSAVSHKKDLTRLGFATLMMRLRYSPPALQEPIPSWLRRYLDKVFVEFMAELMVAAELEEFQDQTANLSAQFVPRYFWYYAALSNFQSQGFLEQYENGVFSSSLTLTRSEMCYALARILDVSYGKLTPVEEILLEALREEFEDMLQVI